MAYLHQVTIYDRVNGDFRQFDQVKRTAIHTAVNKITILFSCCIYRRLLLLLLLIHHITSHGKDGCRPHWPLYPRNNYLYKTLLLHK